MKGVKKDLTGRRFGMLTVIEFAEHSPRGNLWFCKCECGNNTKVSTHDLTTGHSKSCGCVRKLGLHRTHGKRKTRLYKIYANMKQRCYNPNNKSYKNYGERGIAICKEWLDDFMNFYNWAMANGYADTLSIDRIDVNGNYTPTNCRWVDNKTQANNRRTSHKVKYKGKIYTLNSLADKLGVSHSLIIYYIKKGYKLDKIKNPSKSSSPAKKKRD